MFFQKPQVLPTAEIALKGRASSLFMLEPHYVNGRALMPPYPEGYAHIMLGMGCFWGAERKFWQLKAGIWVTAAGYAGGYTPHPTYKEVCSGMTGHTEVVLVAFDPQKLSLQILLQTFWESHDPTQGMRQGNDTGTQYRSAIYVNTQAQLEAVEASKQKYEAALLQAGRGAITTEIALNPLFYYAEPEHQQYLAKNPAGYCGLRGTGVRC
jgi:peptide-methionine (S)-S-oxide reductase